MPYQYNQTTNDVIDMTDGQIITNMGDLVAPKPLKKETFQVFYIPSDKSKGLVPRVIDTIRMVDGQQQSFYSGESLDDLQKRYMNVAIGFIDDVIAEKEAMLTTEPAEITEDEYYRAIGELPPEGHYKDAYGTSFKMSEYLSGRITAVYALVDGRYFTFNDVSSIAHEDIMRKTMHSDAWKFSVENINLVNVLFGVHNALLGIGKYSEMEGGSLTGERVEIALKLIANVTLSPASSDKSQRVDAVLSSLAKALDGVVGKDQMEAVKAILTTEPNEKSYILVQEGGSSSELYVHGHESAEDANEDRIDCADGAYRTSALVTAPRWMTKLPGFYEVVEEVVGSVSNLEFVEVPENFDGEKQRG